MNRNPVKKWKKGKSGNPGGRPKIFAEVKELARQFMQEQGWQGFFELLKNTDNDNVRLKAYEILMAYGFGKPSQKLEIEGNVPLVNVNIANIPSDQLKQIRSILQNAGTPTDTNT
jgi:hypothetical protein